MLLVIINLTALCVGEVTVVCWCVCLFVSLFVQRKFYVSVHLMISVDMWKFCNFTPLLKSYDNLKKFCELLSY